MGEGKKGISKVALYHKMFQVNLTHCTAIRAWNHSIFLHSSLLSSSSSLPFTCPGEVESPSLSSAVRAWRRRGHIIRNADRHLTFASCTFIPGDESPIIRPHACLRNRYASLQVILQERSRQQTY